MHTQRVHRKQRMPRAPALERAAAVAVRSGICDAELVELAANAHGAVASALDDQAASRAGRGQAQRQVRERAAAAGRRLRSELMGSSVLDVFGCGRECHELQRLCRDLETLQVH